MIDTAELRRLLAEAGRYRFYYCDSEDAYLLGHRVDNFYYAHWHGNLGWGWDMSRYLPWGKTVNGFTYSSEPREIGEAEWFRGFLAQHNARLTAENAALLARAEAAEAKVAEAREVVETAKSVSIDLLDFIDEHASVYFACVLEDNYGNRLRALAGKDGEA